MNAHDADGHEATPRAINTTGTDRLLADVVAVPPDQQAPGLAEAILQEARAPNSETRYHFAMRLGVIQGNAERLIALLERQAEEKAAPLAALTTMYDLVMDLLPGRGRMAEIYIDNTPGLRPRIDAARAAIAKGGAP